jgi:hypothetical protein
MYVISSLKLYFVVTETVAMRAEIYEKDLYDLETGLSI